MYESFIQIFAIHLQLFSPIWRCASSLYDECIIEALKKIIFIPTDILFL